ncbi:hypothetical protein HDU76_009601 [Blyttiomyces sp. JEL0837]|nr:hypothetical protein HDU76_009601 [Blyttiomyces sp. JEL0837]
MQRGQARRPTLIRAREVRTGGNTAGSSTTATAAATTTTSGVQRLISYLQGERTPQDRDRNRDGDALGDLDELIAGGGRRFGVVSRDPSVANANGGGSGTGVRDAIGDSAREYVGDGLWNFSRENGYFDGVEEDFNNGGDGGGGDDAGLVRGVVDGNGNSNGNTSGGNSVNWFDDDLGITAVRGFSNMANGASRARPVVMPTVAFSEDEDSDEFVEEGMPVFSGEWRDV